MKDKKREFIILLNVEDIENISEVYNKILRIYKACSNSEKPNISFCSTFEKILNRSNEQGYIDEKIYDTKNSKLL